MPRDVSICLEGGPERVYIRKLQLSFEDGYIPIVRNNKETEIKMAGAIIVCLKFVLIAVVSEILPEVDARRIQQDMEMVDTDIASNHRQTELEHRQAELEHRQAELDVNLLRNILLRATMIPRKNNDSIVCIKLLYI